MHHDDTAERAILGAILTGYPMAGLDLTGPDFYQPVHEAIWDACRRIVDAGKKPDPILVRNLNPTIDAVLLAELVGTVGVHSNTPSHARIITAHADRRWLSDLCTGAVSRLEQDPAVVAEHMRVKLDERNRARQQVRSLGEVLPELIDSIGAGGAGGATSPWPDLDKYIRGLQPGRLYTVGARPGKGKSLFGQAVAATVAGRHGKAAFVASLEMTAPEYAMRFLAADSSVRMRDMEIAHLDEGQWDRISRATAKLSGWPVYINDGSRQDLASIRADARAVGVRNPLGCVVVDYLQLVAPTDSRLSRQEQVGQMTRGLKRLAKELAVPVILLSQLNRESMKAGRRPRLDDLRESGDIEQDSDVVILLHDPDPDSPVPQGGAPLEALIAKNRSGPTGAVDLMLQGAYARIVQAEAPHPQRFGS